MFICSRFRFGTTQAITSGIGNIEANINGQWLLMHVDAKSGTLQSDFPTEDFTLKGEFVLVVTDRAGNKQTFKQKL